MTTEPVHGDVRLTRVLSNTPLSDVHDQAIAGALTRGSREVPWSRFERAQYPVEALALARDLFCKLAGGEYSAVALFSQITASLALNQAPIDFVAASARVSSDEIRHADYCLRMAGLCQGSEVTVEVPSAALASDIPHSLSLVELDFLMLKYAAVGETLAAALLTECRRRASDPVLRALFTSIVSDEVHHARLAGTTRSIAPSAGRTSSGNSSASVFFHSWSASSSNFHRAGMLPHTLLRLPVRWACSTQPRNVRRSRTS